LTLKCAKEVEFLVRTFNKIHDRDAPRTTAALLYETPHVKKAHVINCIGVSQCNYSLTNFEHAHSARPFGTVFSANPFSFQQDKSA